MEVVFCIGSNFGDRDGNVKNGLSWLKDMLDDFRQSSIYATPDCHGGQQEYLNAVAVGKTGLLYPELERKCKEFELTCGRDQAARAAGMVPIDVDLVVYKGIVLRDKDYRSDYFLKGFRELKVEHAHGATKV